MRARAMVLALGVLAALPAAAWAQEEEARVPRVERFEIVADEVGTGWMGIAFGWEGDDAREARVMEVVPGSPAERAGVRRGDVVVRINGQAASEEAVDELREELDEGESVRLELRRDGRSEEKVVVAGRRPERVVFRGGPEGRFPGLPEGGDRTIIIRMDTLEAHMDSLLQHMDSLRVGLWRGGRDSVIIRVDTVMSLFRDSLLRTLPREFRRLEGERGLLPFMFEFGPRSIAGAEFAEMNEGLGRYFRTTEGLLVLQVAPESPAARAGLEAGDVVLQAGGRAVREVGDLREAFSGTGDRTVRLTVLRQGQRREIDVRWEGRREFHFRRDEPRFREREREPQFREREPRARTR